MEVRAEEPCGQMCSRATVAALAFFEESGGLPWESALPRDSVVVGAIRDHAAELAVACPQEQRKTRQVLAMLWAA
eukprot:7460966-Lingulodinium_polyedra.AAC.1